MNCCQRKNPNFNEQIDPKCNWAVHHLEHVSGEINRADYYTLLRVPGIGTKSCRGYGGPRYAKLDFSDLNEDRCCSETCSVFYHL